MKNTSTNRRQRSAVLRRAEMRRMRNFYKKLSRFAIAFAIMMGLVSGMLSVRSFAKGSSSRSPRMKYYTSITIEKGESLSSIADTYRGDDYASRSQYIAEVVELNHLSSADQIRAGGHLIIPYFSEDPSDL